MQLGVPLRLSGVQFPNEWGGIPSPPPCLIQQNQPKTIDPGQNVSTQIKMMKPNLAFWLPQKFLSRGRGGGSKTGSLLGTYICVSGSTYQACAEDFHFRRLGRVTVPGKAAQGPGMEWMGGHRRPPSEDLRRRASPGNQPLWDEKEMDQKLKEKSRKKIPSTFGSRSLQWLFAPPPQGRGFGAKN